MLLYQSKRLKAYHNRLIHGFTGKPHSLGGAQSPADRVRANRQALCEALQVDPAHLIVPDQVHSAQIKTSRDDSFEETDAVILLDTHVPALLMFADCTPVLLYDPVCHIGAVIHAGWRGTAQQIAAKTAHRLMTDFASQPKNLIAIIGPAIGGCCYEVSPEVIQALSQTTAATPDQFIIRHAHGKAHVDLQTINRLQLEDQGLSQVEILPACTRCEANTLWSHRRGESGRQGAFFMLL